MRFYCRLLQLLTLGFFHRRMITRKMWKIIVSIYCMGWSLWLSRSCIYKFLIDVSGMDAQVWDLLLLYLKRIFFVCAYNFVFKALLYWRFFLKVYSTITQMFVWHVLASKSNHWPLIMLVHYYAYIIVLKIDDLKSKMLTGCCVSIYYLLMNSHFFK